MGNNASKRRSKYVAEIIKTYAQTFAKIGYNLAT